jgi:hypothetical protein
MKPPLKLKEWKVFNGEEKLQKSSALFFIQRFLTSIAPVSMSIDEAVLTICLISLSRGKNESSSEVQTMKFLMCS